MLDIESLRETAKSHLSISYHLKYLDHGRHEIVIGGGHNDAISVDETAWTLTGTARNKRMNLPINKIFMMDGTPAEDMVVHLRASAIIEGKSVNVDLGKHRVRKHKFVDDESGILILA